MSCSFRFFFQLIVVAQQNGTLSALPYLVCWLVTIVSSMIGDRLVEKRVLSKTNVRKLFSTLSAVISAVAIVALSFTTSEQSFLAVLLLVVGLASKYAI